MKKKFFYKSQLTNLSRNIASSHGKKTFIIPDLERVVFASSLEQCRAKFTGHYVRERKGIANYCHVVFGFCW